jgi:hypothetical protein
VTDAPEPTDPPEPSRAAAVAWAAARVALAVPFYGLAWLAAAAGALVWFGARAGWRDVRTFTEGE